MTDTQWIEDCIATLDAKDAEIARLRAALDRLVQAAEDMAQTVNSSMADDAITEARAALA